MRDFEDGVGRLVCTIDLFADLKTSYCPKNTETFSIPYRALIPKGIEGLLVSGRCVSADVPSFGALRLMVGCATTGQAAGAAAALSIKENVGVRDVNISELQRILSELGAII